MSSDTLPAFRGDLPWIHAQEGSGLALYGRSCYWPAGASGVTLDPGFDLGHQKRGQLEKYYASLLTDEQMEACRDALGLTGAEAKARVEESDVLRSIRIPQSDQERLFPLVAAPYWKRVADRFPPLRDTCTPAEVQTALLSLAFNRGASNGGLDTLGGPLANEEWERVGAAIARMQQGHRLESIALRRRREAALVLQPLLSRRTPTPPGGTADAALRNAQEYLCWSNTYAGPVDGIFGQGTEQGVLNFQRRKHLDAVDGIIGTETWNALL